MQLHWKSDYIIIQTTNWSLMTGISVHGAHAKVVTRFICTKTKENGIMEAEDHELMQNE